MPAREKRKGHSGVNTSSLRDSSRRQREAYSKPHWVIFVKSKETMIQSLFIMSKTGEVMIEKHWRGITPRNVCDFFWDEVNRHDMPEAVPPILQVNLLTKAFSALMVNFHPPPPFSSSCPCEYSKSVRNRARDATLLYWTCLPAVGIRDG